MYYFRHTGNHLLSSTCVQHAKTFAKMQNICRTFLEVVTCKIKHQNIFANVLQVSYFTRNHGLMACFTNVRADVMKRIISLADGGGRIL